MNHRHRSRVVGVARLLAALAVVAVGAGVVVGGSALAAAAVVAAVVAVGAAVLAVRVEARGRAALAAQRSALDGELDRRLARARRGHDAGVAVLRSRIEAGDRDRQQLELALQVAMLRREPEDRRAPAGGRSGGEPDRAGAKVATVHLHRAW
jgi:hypothetical protein